MNITRTANTPKPSTRQATNPAEGTSKQHMQGVLLEGKVDHFLNKAYVEDEFLTAKEPAIQNVPTGTIPEAMTSSTCSSTAAALKKAGAAVALGAGLVGMTGVLAGMAAVPMLGGLMNSVFLSDERSLSFLPATVGVVANLAGTIGLITGNAGLAVPGLALSSACSFAAAAICHRHQYDSWRDALRPVFDFLTPGVDRVLSVSVHK